MPPQGKRLSRPSFSPLSLSRANKRRPRRPDGLSWMGHWLLWGGIGLLLGQRLRFVGQPAQVPWWRALPVSGPEGSLPPVQAELPLYHLIADGLLPWLAEKIGIPSEGILRAVSALACLLILLLCWRWGNFWSAGLWGLSPWVLTQGLEPGGESLASLVLLVSSGVGPGARLRWGGLALACALTYRVWLLALVWAALWISQHWPRQRWQGLFWLLPVMGLSWLGQVELHPPPFPKPEAVSAALASPSLPGQGVLAVLATLMLPLGLALVRLGWPWAERQQTLLSLAGLGHVLGMGVLAVWLWDPQVNLLQQSARWGLVALPFLCLSAGGVLAEIPCRGWRRVLGSLLLVSSFLLSWQALA